MSSSREPNPAVEFLSDLVCFCTNIRLWLLLLLLPGCALGTVKGAVKDPAFQQENRPIRIIRLTVLHDSSRSKEELHRFISQAGQKIEDQTGIRLEVVSWKEVTRFRGTSMMEELNYLAIDSREDWHWADVILGFTSIPPAEYAIATAAALVLPVPVLGAVAYTDPVYHRYIMIRELTEWNFIHEFFHCFVLSRHHSWGALSLPTPRFLPFVPMPGSIYLLPEDRKEVLKNKWRNFRNPVLELPFEKVAYRIVFKTGEVLKKDESGDWVPIPAEAGVR